MFNELDPLQLRDSRDQRKMVVLAAARVANLAPAAHVTMFVRFRIKSGIDCRGHELLRSGTHSPEERCEVCDPPGFPLELTPRRDHVHLLRLEPLHLR